MTVKMKMNGQSHNPQEELLAWLQKKLPEAFTEGKIDCKKLKATLGESVDANGERYGLSWAGKNDCFRHIQEPTTATLKPVRDESVDFDTTKNLFIEGDNLQVLKVLQKSYYGQVKMIYIDPPYNTGSDSFIYPDRFQETQEEYMERVGDKEEGHVTRDGMWQKNSGDNGHYHSNWLSMMYPRLFLARNLLRDDGVIFVSIDDHEVHNLRCLMNEIYGEDNFRAQISWQKKYSVNNNQTGIAPVVEYVLVYSKSQEFINGLIPRTEESINRYKNPDNDPRGPWKPVDYWGPVSPIKRPNLAYTITNPNTGLEIKPSKKSWKYSFETYQNHVNENKIWWGSDGKSTVPALKLFLSEVRDGLIPSNLWLSTDVGHTDESSKELQNLFDKQVLFDTPKPVRLIKRMLEIANVKNDDIVLDFFAGSATTAHAILEINAEDNKTRRYILVQIEEKCVDNSEPKNLGYNTIADIAKERIRRVAKKLKNENMDMGFKVLSLNESNFKIWRKNVPNAKELAEQMHMFIDNLKAESTQENVLYELMLKSGLDLNVPVEVRKADGKKYFALDGGKLVVCLEDAMTQPLADAVIALKPQKVICLDGAFKGNDQLKTNTALQMEAAKIDFRVI